MEKYNNLPIFQIDFTDDSIWNNISLVDFPAIERDFIKLSKQGEIQLHIDEEKREISGPVILPDQLIYRKDSKGEYYIRFSKDVIKKMAYEFFKRDTQNNGNLMHQVEFDGVTFFESFIIDKERGICPKEFSDLPDGSWLVTAKVENDEVWNLIKEGVIRGFSIDCQVEFTQIKENDEIKTVEELIDYLKKHNK